MDGYVIYLDLLLLLNFGCDFFLLWAAGHFLHRRGILWRLLLAALAGAIYGAGIVFPKVAIFYLPPVAVLFSLVLLRIAYPYVCASAFLRLTGVFYLAAFMLAGAALASVSLLQSRGITVSRVESVRCLSLLAAAPVLLVLLRRGYAAVRRGWRRQDFSARVEVRVGDRCCRLEALVDTGNDLSEPLSGRPVMVADAAAIQKLLPERLMRLSLLYQNRPAEILQRMGQNRAEPDPEGWLRRLRLIPFASLGKSNGLLLGFLPDSALVIQQGSGIRVDAVVALNWHGFGGEQGYQAIISPLMMAEAECIREVSA